MPSEQHILVYRAGVPFKTTKRSQVDGILDQARSELRALAGVFARNVEFRHKISERDATVGGPKGIKQKVWYVEVAIRFNGLLTGDAIAYRQKYMNKRLEDVVADAKKSSPFIITG